MTLEQILSQPQYVNLSNADAASLHNAPSPRSGPIYCTYLWLGEQPEFGGNVAGKLRSSLLAWAGGPDLSQLNEALPNPGQLMALHSRLDGHPGIDLASLQAPGMLQLFASGVPGLHDPILTANQAAALLGFGYLTRQPVTEADIAAARLVMARRASIQALRQQVVGAATGWVNQTLNAYDPTSPVEPPTLADFKAVVAALA